MDGPGALAELSLGGANHGGLDRRRARPFLQNLTRLSGATTVGGLIVFAATPVITRLYSPSEFGVLGVFATGLSVVVVIAALRYDFAIPYPEDEREAAAILALALIAVAVTSAICALLVLSGVVSRLAALRAVSGNLLLWLPIGMWASATYASLSTWMVRHRDFAIIGKTKVTQGVLQACSQILLGAAGFGASGLIVGQIVGSSGGLIRLWRRLREVSPRALIGIKADELRTTARRYRRFPLFSAPAVLLDSATGAMPLLFVAAQFGSSPAGLYTLIQRVIAMPFALLTVNLGQIVFGDFAELRRLSPTILATTFRRRVLQVGALGLGLVIPLLIIVPFVLPRVFGRRWVEASDFFLILSPMLYFGFVSSPFGFMVDVLRRQDLHLIRDSTRAFVTAATLIGCVRLNLGLRQALMVVSAAGTICGVFYLYISYRAVTSYTRTLEPSDLASLESSVF